MRKGVEKRYEAYFGKVGNDNDRVHKMDGAVRVYGATKRVTVIKILRQKKSSGDVHKQKNNYGGEIFWANGYFVSTIIRNCNEPVISDYIKAQDSYYTMPCNNQQLGFL